MKKRLFATLVSVSLLSTMVLSGCGQNSTDEKVTSGVIRIAYNNIENYPHYKGLSVQHRRLKTGLTEDLQ